MKTNTVTNTSPSIPYLAKFWVSSYEPKCCQPIKLHNSLKCNKLSREYNIKRFSYRSNKTLLNIFY